MVSIVGARPQFIKAAAVGRVLRQQHREILVHTGQHYDYEMSGIFFDGLELPPPDVNLGVGSATHGVQTGAMLARIEELLMTERPEWLVIYGDTNSTLAGALAGSKLSVKIAHVEAGLRSFNRRMPEEINRIVADHLSNLLLCPSNTAIENLAAEGVTEHVHLVGDVMLDILTWAKQRAATNPPTILERLGLRKKAYVLATLHRSENTDDLCRLASILKSFNSLQQLVVFAVHPRTRRAIESVNYQFNANVRLIEPVGYLDMVSLSDGATLILTDSGGLQKEAYWLAVPCITLREQTEWVETIETGWNTLVGCDSEKIVQAVCSFAPPTLHPALYGDGCAAARCVELLQ
ncbi:MAG: UDP-N-acetylglucosamine 2-epimerase (non-hydrolyzing) [Candidatus Acidiferrum sp.]